jgi:hypothetical protein
MLQAPQVSFTFRVLVKSRSLEQIRCIKKNVKIFCGEACFYFLKGRLITKTDQCSGNLNRAYLPTHLPEADYFLNVQ